VVTGQVQEFEWDLVAGAMMGGVMHTVVASIERIKLLLHAGRATGKGAQVRGSTFILVQHLL
jgi:solute carrier family 25 (adenine nucleotide translocator) protein 4/5/6/31